MTEEVLHPLERILRWCAAAAPEPWYPRLYAGAEGMNPQALAPYLDDLRLRGLIERVPPGDDDRGPGALLTREGERVLLDPELLDHLRAGRPLSARDRATLLRQSLSGRGRAPITLVLLIVNVLVFAVGWYHARQHGAGDAFLNGRAVPAVVRQLRECGALTGRDLLDGQWWRLVTAGFVHVGWLNLLLSSLWLYSAGRLSERLWGRSRHVAIYLLGVAGGNCLAVAHQPLLVLGSFGGLEALFGAELVWFLLNRRYLPRELLGQLRNVVIYNVVLTGVLLVMVGGRDWSLAGGAVTGAACGLLLQLHRFGPPGWRWLALAGFAPLAWYAHYTVADARRTNETWHEVEARHFVETYQPVVVGAVKKAQKVYAAEIEPLLEMHPTRRKRDEVDAALALLDEQLNDLRAAADRLARGGPYGRDDVEEARQVGREYVRSVIELFALAGRVLREGDEHAEKDRRALREQQQKVEDMRKKWKDLFEPL